MVMMPELEQTNGSYKNIFAHANEEECPQKRGTETCNLKYVMLV